MSEITVASRYAQSLIDLAKEQSKVEEVFKDIKLFHDTVKSSNELRAVLANPIVSPHDKKEILKKLFSGKVDKITLAYFEIMVNKGREGFLYQSAKQFVNLYNHHKGIVTAKIVSASALNEAMLKEVETIIAKELNKQIVLESKVDADLIGGFVLTVGDKQFDTSISKKLQQLKKEFQTKTV